MHVQFLHVTYLATKISSICLLLLFTSSFLHLSISSLFPLLLSVSTQINFSSSSFSPLSPPVPSMTNSRGSQRRSGVKGFHGSRCLTLCVYECVWVEDSARGMQGHVILWPPDTVIDTHTVLYDLFCPCTRRTCVNTRARGRHGITHNATALLRTQTEKQICSGENDVVILYPFASKPYKNNGLIPSTDCID